MQRTALSLIIGLLALGLGWITLFWNPQVETFPPHRGLSLADPPAGGDFVLKSSRGPVALRDHRGKVVVLYFGYTLCPDICPTSLGYLSVALSALRSEELQQVQGLFVSVDPERDDLERLQRYGEYFHPRILGITGTPDQVSAVARQYGAAHQRTETDSALGYVVDHSAFTYVIGPDGKLRRTLPHGTPPEQILQAVRDLLPAGPNGPS